MEKFDDILGNCKCSTLCKNFRAGTIDFLVLTTSA